jgi:hypothetical protein
LQKILAAILIIAFTGQTFNQSWYYLGYIIEKKAYMSRCINKSHPEMHCDGKCQLMKKIQEQERKEQGQAPKMKMASKLEVLSSKSFFLSSLEIPVQNKKNNFSDLVIGTPVDKSSSIFHPPSIAA